LTIDRAGPLAAWALVLVLATVAATAVADPRVEEPLGPPSVPTMASLGDPLAAALHADLGSTAKATPAEPTPASDCKPHPPIEITEDRGPRGFVSTLPAGGETLHRPGSGVVAGNGTAENPYTIEGWCIVPTVRPAEGPPMPRRSGITIEATSAHVVIRDTVIDGRPGGWTAPDDHRQPVGIEIADAANVTIEGNEIVHNRRNVRVLEADGVHVAGNTIADGDQGIHVAASTGATIASNAIRGHDRGIHLADAGRAVVEANTLAANEDALYAVSSPQPRIVGNAIEGNADGIDLRHVASAHVARNRIVDNSFDGVELYRSDDARLQDNVIERNVVGVLAVRSSPVQLAHNNVGSNANAGLSAWMDAHVNATRNWWSHASGPTGDVRDACTGDPIDGEGGQISTLSGGEACLRPWRTSPNPAAGPPSG